ncbi:hypothetical protein GGF46_000884 [Coemansia sp. RSA 552]|nr:hypothetical protein GGF46_000884 [Coemansia sp. RSA 552]
MAPRPPEDPDTPRLNFLHSASHAAFKICPQLAAFYGGEFLTLLGDQRTSNTIQRQLCMHCGVPLADGRSVSRVSVVTNSRRKRSKRAKQSGSAGNSRRVIRIRPNSADTSADPWPTKQKDRLDQMRDRKNSVMYTCAMCTTRTIYPGATKSALRIAGLAGSMPGGSVNQMATPAAAEPSSTVSAPAAEPARNRPAADIKPGTAVAANNAAQTRAGAESKKRKRHKSNLLATVAANKKKAEEKKNAAGDSFSLTDFLSGL